MRQWLSTCKSQLQTQSNFIMEHTIRWESARAGANTSSTKKYQTHKFPETRDPPSTKPDSSAGVAASPLLISFRPLQRPLAEFQRGSGEIFLDVHSKFYTSLHPDLCWHIGAQTVHPFPLESVRDHLLMKKVCIDFHSIN